MWCSDPDGFPENSNTDFRFPSDTLQAPQLKTLPWILLSFLLTVYNMVNVAGSSRAKPHMEIEPLGTRVELIGVAIVILLHVTLFSFHGILATRMLFSECVCGMFCID